MMRRLETKVKAAAPAGEEERQKWLQPLLMPKINCMVAHVRDFVEQNGYWAIMSEESFKYYQKPAKRE